MSLDESISCRICREEEGPFVSPCLCSGSMAHVHTPCLEKWVLTRQSTLCQVCKTEYEISRQELRRMGEWSAPRPLSPSLDDTLDFYCALIWIFFITRTIHTSYTVGMDEVPRLVGQVLGKGTVYYLWWTSFWVNFIYYSTICILLYDKWITVNTRFVFANRRKRAVSRPASPSVTTARSPTLTTGRAEESPPPPLASR